MKKILTLGIVLLLTANNLLPAQEITFSETKFDWGTVHKHRRQTSHYQKYHYRLRMHLVRMV